MNGWEYYQYLRQQGMNHADALFDTQQGYPGFNVQDAQNPSWPVNQPGAPSNVQSTDTGIDPFPAAPTAPSGAGARTPTTPTAAAGGFWDKVKSNMFSGEKSAGRAMSVGSGIGGGIGTLAGGLINMFGDQPDAMMKAYKRLLNAYQNIDDPEIQRQTWDAPVFRQIAQYAPELMRDLSERLEDYETLDEGDAGLRAQEDVALARVSERARRGDPLAQRIATQRAQSDIGRAIGRGAQTAQELAARRGMPGVAQPGASQAAADYASRVGQANILASRGDMANAERAALIGASSIRQQRESSKERAMNVRNNFRNAMSNRQLRIAMSNQQSRQQAADKNQSLAQRLHEGNLSMADRRRIENQDRRNRWETEEHDREVARARREGEIDVKLGELEDQNDRARIQGIGQTLTGAGQLAGTFLGAGMMPS